MDMKERAEVIIESVCNDVDTFRLNAKIIAQAYLNQCEVNRVLVEALRDVVTQYPLIHEAPVPAWIRNAEEVLKQAEDV